MLCCVMWKKKTVDNKEKSNLHPPGFVVYTEKKTWFIEFTKNV